MTNVWTWLIGIASGCDSEVLGKCLLFIVHCSLFNEQPETSDPIVLELIVHSQTHPSTGSPVLVTGTGSHTSYRTGRGRGAVDERSYLYICPSLGDMKNECAQECPYTTQRHSSCRYSTGYEANNAYLEPYLRLLLQNSCEQSKPFHHPVISNHSFTMLPRSNKEYGTQEYWENRFSTEESFEWLLSYAQLAPQLEPILALHGSRYDQHFASADTEDAAAVATAASSDAKSRVRILVLGCGNAPFSADLYDAGYTNIVNIDYSSTVICTMKERHALSRPHMQWLVMDMTNFPTSTATTENTSKMVFDIVIDKAAMDALLVNEGDVWYPNPTVVSTAYSMCHSVSRVLTNGGTFVQISLTQPHFRTKYLLHHHTPPPPQANKTTTKNSSFANARTTPSSANEEEDRYCAEFGWTLRCEPALQEQSAASFGHYLYMMTKQ